MMAKMFYTLEEAKNVLGKSEDEIRKFARDGRLREFRDGPRLMFKADQVEQLKGEMGGGSGEEPMLDDQMDLGGSNSGLIGLVDTTGASGTSITLSDGDVGSGLGSGIGTGLGTGLSGSGLTSGMVSRSGSGSSGMPVQGHDVGQSTGGGMTMHMKDDTAALAQDLGLSGSLGGVPSPGRPSGGQSGTGLSGTAAGRAGINVFGHDDGVENIDPLAQTNISGGIRDQMALEGMGSGSGLLDLTRESDDTSLGAVLDEITPGPAARRAPVYESPADSFGGSTPPPPPRMVESLPQIIERPDWMAPAFGAAALAAALVILFGAFLLIAAVMGTRPDAQIWFARNNMNVFMSAGLGLAAVLVFFVIGAVVGRIMTPKVSARR